MTKPPAPDQSRQRTGSRSAQAAARVAARYAQAPSYSQLLAEAEAEAQAAPPAVQVTLPGLLSASSAPQMWEPEAESATIAVQTPALESKPVMVPAQSSAPDSLEVWESEFTHHTWEPDHALRRLELISAHAPQPAEASASPAEETMEQPASADSLWSASAAEPIEPIQPIHANLIEFPREIVAPRKRRPRRAEGPLAADERQLNIFEVDLGYLPVQQEVADPTSAWVGHQWPSIELEAQPEDELGPQPAPVSQPDLEQAPLSHRMLAAVVDGALITCAFLGSVLVAAANIDHAPAVKIVVYSAIAALLLTGLLYQVLFLILVKATPGMMWACISLCTIEGQIPTRAQLRRRLGALLLSLIPVGLGIVWSLFDDDRLCWHDRLSKTYLRVN
jgi:uncharacterized RDD family membrane protein YckC